MSYPPPRPPMGPMPGMMPPGYGYAPMGMMPMGMGMMPPMMRPGMPMNGNPNKPPQKKLVPQEIPKSDDNEDKPPVTTVFVGNISERAPDAMIRQMLQRCGNVLSWKRVQGASGKLQAFGFCEYEYPEATLRCIRLLNEWQIADKKLVVKVDAKTKTLLEEYKNKKREKIANEEKEEGEEVDDPDDLDEFTQREDRVAKAGLDAIMREYLRELTRAPEPDPNAKKQLRPKKEEFKPEEPKIMKMKEIKPFKEKVKDLGLNDMEMEAGMKGLINSEIHKFRDLHKGEEEEKDEEEKERERRRREDRERERERRQRAREMALEMRVRDRERERERRRSRSRSRSRSRGRDRSRSRSRERERDREREDEEEAYERRRLERKLREKEAAYQERLKNWEARERKKAREYEKEKEKEEERKIEEVKEGRRLKEFLEDYDDERDDPKYYKGSALSRRLKEREKEMEADARDRGREKEEYEEMRRKLLEEGHPDPDAEIAKIEKAREEALKPQVKAEPVEPVAPEEAEPEPVPPPGDRIKLQPTMKPVDAAPAVVLNPNTSSPESDRGSPVGIIIPEPTPVNEDSTSQPFIGPAPREDGEKRIGFSGIKFGNVADSPGDSQSSFKDHKRKKLTVGEVFNQDEEESNEKQKKRKLVPLDYSEEERAAVSSKPTTIEEKRKHIKNLIDRIPTGKEELFAFGLDWSMVDTTLMEKRIKPWVNKKIIEYIGEEEPTLTEFICQKVMAHSGPDSVLNDVAMVLDEEAEVFVVKMWRLLIYETEAKKLGLVVK